MSNFTEIMKFVVTGGAGFVGNNIVRLLLSKRHEVVVIDNLHTGKINNLDDVLEEIEFHNIDIRNVVKLENVLKDIDGIFHEAALTAVPESFKKSKEYHDVNVIGTKNIFKIAEKRKIRIVYASSSSVYGNAKSIPIKENFEKKPINPYGQTKLDDEILTNEFENLSVIGLRYFNIYGVGQTGSYAGVITKFLENIKNKKPLIVNGSGNQVRDFIHVKDIAKANLTIMENKRKKGFFNIGTGVPISINDLAKKMIYLSNTDLEIIHGPGLSGDVEMSQADMELTRKTFDWNHEINLNEGLSQLIKNEIDIHKD